MTTRPPGVTFTEAEDAYGQIHPIESPQVIEQGLKNLEQELNKLPNDEKKAWSQAQEKCPELVGNDHRLMFLRCEIFNADLAATRLVAYWEKRLEIFGSAKAFLPLRLKDALKGDEIAMGHGFLRIVIGAKDPSNRAILYVDPAQQNPSQYTRESMLRGLWYVIHAVLEDAETQKKGIVLVANPSKAAFAQFDRVQVKMNMESLKGCLPVRISVFHICHPPSFFALIFPIVKLFMGARLKKRVKVHSGSQDKVLSKLSKYGLSKDQLPTDLGGQVSLDHDGWLQERRDADL